MKMKVYVQVHVFDWKKEKNAKQQPLLRSRGFLRKIGLFGKRIFELYGAEYGGGTKYGQIDLFPCYDKR